MTPLTARDFDELAQVDHPHCVSILMPSHRTGREVKQDPIRLKNLLKEAKEHLCERGRSSKDAGQQLAPLRELVEDETFWGHQDSGLAAFASPSERHVFQIPYTLSEHSLVGNHFYLAPLVPLLTEDAHFLVLGISPKQVCLLNCTRYTERQIDLPGWPEDFDDLAAYIDEEASIQFHTGAPPVGRQGRRAAMFHGQVGGDTIADRKQRLLEYCRLIDQRVGDVAGEIEAPLILACDERLAPIYREASRLPNVHPKAVTGSPDDRSPAALRDAAWSIMQSRVHEERQAIVARYEQAAGHDKIARRLDSVLAAAQDGRIDALLFAKDAESWGQYDPDKRRLSVNDSRTSADEELVNLAAIYSYRQGADVRSFPQDDLPEPEAALAILRY